MIDYDKYIAYCGDDAADFLGRRCSHDVDDGGECPFNGLPCLTINPNYGWLQTKFDVTSTSSPTKLFNIENQFDEIEIDGVVLTNVTSSYTFSTTGEHVVRFKQKDPTTIVGSAFSGCTNLKEVTLTNSLTLIKENAFGGCTKLSEVILPTANTLTIGSYAFGGCNITSLIVPNNVAFSGNSSGAFMNNPIKTLVWDTNNVYSNWPVQAYVPLQSLESITYGDNITVINSQSVAGASKLTSVTISDGVQEIGSSAFISCTALTDVSIGNDVKTIGAAAFQNCTGLTSITIPDSVTIIDSQAFLNCSGATSLTIGNNVKTIGGAAFQNCYGIKNLVIPDSVETIVGSAFYTCTGLTSVTIPDSVTSIGNNSFYGLYALKELNYNAKVPLTTYFISVGSIETLIVGDSVPSIGDSVFNRYPSLTSVTIGNSVTIIGSYAFLQCHLNGYLNIPDSVTYIGVNAFNGCAYLTDIIIGTGITSIDGMAFNNCGGLTEITINAATPPTLGNYVFANTNECPIYVPAESVNAYKTASGWSEYADRIHSI